MQLNYSAQKKLAIFLFLSVPLLLTLILSVYPLMDMFYTSMTQWDGVSRVKEFIGFGNYLDLFGNLEMLQIFMHNIAYFVSGVFQIILGIILANILNNNIRGRNFFRSFIFMPYILNGVAVAFMFTYVYDYNGGILNTILAVAGFEKVSWLGTKGLVNYSLSAISAWKYTGFNMVLMLGGLQSIDSEFFEAAKIDGANAWQTFRYITLPSLKRIIELNLFLVLRGSMNAFEQPFIMTNGGPMGASDTFLTKAMSTAFEFRSMGLASAMGIFVLALVLLLTGVQNKLIRGKDSR